MSTHPQHLSADPFLLSALAALDAASLRTFLIEFQASLLSAQRAELVAALLRHAVRTVPGWRLALPASPQVERVRTFIERARQRHVAEAAEVDEMLRLGIQASMAGDHQAAREIFELLWPPLLDCEIDIGVDELLSDELATDLDDCARRYLLAIYLTTPLEERAEAVFEQLVSFSEEIEGWEPIASLELLSPLPDLELFLPRWRDVLQRDETDQHFLRRHWLREVTLRLDGIGGLERLARTTRHTADFRAWCDLLVAADNWPAVLAAAEAALDLAADRRGAGSFHDLAFLAAKKLGSSDLEGRLEKAWLEAPRWNACCATCTTAAPRPRSWQKGPTPRSASPKPAHRERWPFFAS